MARFIFLLLIVLAFLLMVGYVNQIRIRKILKEKGFKIWPIVLGFINTYNFYKIYKNEPVEGFQDRYRNRLTFDVFISVLYLGITIFIIAILINDFYR